MTLLVQACSDNPVDSPGGDVATDVEQSIQTRINAYRASKGLPALTLNSVITAEARTHSRNMSSGTTAFGHDGFDDRVNTISKSIQLVSAGENVAFVEGAADPAADAVEGWINSTGHRQNIEGDYNLTGIGVVRNAQGRYYFTQIFVRE